MNIYYSMIYVLLSKKLPLIDLATNDSPLEVNAPRLYSEKIEDGNIYVVSNIESFQMPQKSGNYVLVFHETEALGLRFPKGTRALLVGGCHDSISIFEVLSEIFILIERWNTEFLRLSLTNSTAIFKLLEFFYSIIQCRMVYEDENFKHIYEFPLYRRDINNYDVKYATNVSPSPSTPEYASYQQFIITMNSTEIYSLHSDSKVKIMYYDAIKNAVVVRKLYKGDKLIGRLSVKYDEDLINNDNMMDGYCRIIDMFANHLETAMIIALRGSVSEEHDAVHTAFYNLIFNKNSRVQSEVIGFLPEREWLQYDKYLIATVKIEKRSVFADVSGYLQGHFEKVWTNCLSLRHDNRIILIFNISKGNIKIEDITSYLGDIRKECQDMINFVAYSDYFENVIFADMYYIQCDYLIGHEKLWKNESWHLVFEDYSMDYIVDYLSSYYPSEFVCHSGILEIAKYDEQNESELLRTLYYYVKCHLNTTEAAKEIAVHRTTFIKRIQKICKLHDFKFDSTDELLHILLSFKFIGMNG